MPQPNKITSWSFSRWSTYNQCPLKAKLKFIDKMAEPGSPAMERGSKIHTDIEHYIKGAVPRLHKDADPTKAFGALFRDLRRAKAKDDDAVSIEDTWAYRADWTETTYDDWSHCWLRIKIDCATVEGTEDNVVVGIRDWKTGKYRKQNESDYALQLDLYALGALTLYQDTKEVTVQPTLVYVDEGVTHATGVYTKTDLPRLKKEWTARVKPMLADTKFAPKPNNFCRWCHFRKENGGPCKF